MNKYQCYFMVLYLLYNSLEANDNLYDIIKANELTLGSKSYINPYPQQCSELLEEFSQFAANFTLCSITNARPIRLCEHCIDEYMNFSSKFKELLKTVVNGTSCGSYLISQDRFDVILEYHDHIMTVWDKGHCNDCFEFIEGVPILSNNTKKFNEMAKDTMNCIITKLDPTTNNTDKVCHDCMPKYVALNDFYGTLSKDSIGVDSVCMDTVDLMNTTRSIWSKNLNCCKMRKSPEIVFLCSTAVIALLPIIFYIMVRFCGPIRDLPNVLKESRFKQSLLRTTAVQERTD